MRRWFLSYHSPDQALAERLKAALERKDTGAHVFFAPWSLRAGGFWSRALAEEIAQADAFILLVGERGVGNWQVLEYDEALDRRVKSLDFPVILVLLEGQTAPGLPFLRQLHWIVTPNPPSEKDVAKLLDAALGSSARQAELWRYTSPYRGLPAMEEKDSDYFFGRERETVEVLNVLAAASDRLPVLLGNSGVGKSSLAQAGMLAALKRQAWPDGIENAPEWPRVFQESRRWCFLTLKPGTEPLKALVETFLDTWQLGATDPDRVKQQNGWIELLRDGKAMLRDLLDATERRYKELDRTKPHAFLLYVDQGEELYVRAEEHQRPRFSEVIAQGVADPRLYMLMSMRTDFLGELQKDEPLFKVHCKIDVPPLREAELRKVVSRPAELLSARFETDSLVDIITRRTAEDSVKDVGALPLLSYTLDDMWTKMVKRGDGLLRLPAQSFELGGVLVDRADTFLASHPKSLDELRRIFTLKLATVREGEEPTRRRAPRSEFADAEWRLVSELADHPNRLLVTATPEGGETYAEVAHEAIFRRWDKLRNWIAAEGEFLAWKTGLAQAQSWLEKRADDLPPALRNFVVRSSEVDSERREAARQLEYRRIKADEELARLRAENEAREQRERADAEARARQVEHRRVRRLRGVVGVLIPTFVVALVALWNYQWLKREVYSFIYVRPYVLAPDVERALKPGDTFQECAKDCPTMVVIPAGQFKMGSPESETGRRAHEGPQHEVTIARPFAVSKFEVTWDEWDACVEYGGCAKNISDSAWGRGRRSVINVKQPVINVTWDEAQEYVAWLSNMTGKSYRLLTEAEWEYAARAGTNTAYFWGDEIGKGNANCSGCGSQWDDDHPAPVGSFAPNAFGLYDMHGNVWEWVEDCYQSNYNGAPTDGSASISRDCINHVVRGGSWIAWQIPQSARSASRDNYGKDNRRTFVGFRVGRTLTNTP